MRRSRGSAVPIGALVPLSRPGWVEAGRHLLAGLQLAVRDVNETEALAGRSLELVVRDTAADPGRAAVAVEELTRDGVVALVGEYHSVAARAAAAAAEALEVPFLCSSAVLDELTPRPADWVARVAPTQSHSWCVFADHLLRAGHVRVAAVMQRSIYWEAGIRILSRHLAARCGSVVELTADALSPAAVCDELAGTGATALLLLVGHPEPAISIVQAVRRDPRLTGVTIGAPAGQPEFAPWGRLSGGSGSAVPFLRYRPEQLSPLAARVDDSLREQLREPPSFVALEGYDSIAVIADVLRRHDAERPRTVGFWSEVAVEGTRGRIRFSRPPDVPVWQWVWPPVQVVERDPAGPTELRLAPTRSEVGEWG
ncbi:ABC transporter substrate-binding protein [Microlunatus flavus]|uniref:ABC-type branched-chain amino acid transport system, substrate-binding protein n=1 Tax=Microlunatus flavus TaxID=1036181 RepID=A0A1H9JKH5_9ACTN|nr:ABC transporter substrate-binding protein [Microlunatus flavus]SEQ87336.1 ABC-type branched-chain amino acid transport system, substrate-binding protein [Microlunatus flavus]